MFFLKDGNRLNLFFLILFIVIVCPSFIYSSHNANRYFPFLEKPEDYVTRRKKTYLTPSLFLTTASSAFRKGGGSCGIPELWGNYDLKDIIFALKQVDPFYIDPTFLERGTQDWVGKSIKFKVNGKVTSRGLTLGYKQNLGFLGLSLGGFIPLAHVKSTARFNFDAEHSDINSGNLKPGERYQVDRIRAKVHEDLGLKGSEWSKTGFGDLDLFLQFNHNWDHELLIRNIDFNLRFGVLCPTGMEMEIDYPTSVPFMDNGNWGIYFDMVTDLELKQDLRVGVMLGFIDLLKETQNRRISVYKEPVIFSPLKADTQVNPGWTFKVSPYLEFSNLRDGLNIQGRYTYLKHGADKWKDMRSEKTVKSYLDQTVDSLRDLNEYPGYVDDQKIKENKYDKKYISRNTSSYLTLEVTYDSKEAFNNWWLEPAFYFIYDYPAGGGGVAKTHQVTLGVELHF
ncbi:MAG: hypothetical protein ABIA74_04210 [bacterium]